MAPAEVIASMIRHGIIDWATLERGVEAYQKDRAIESERYDAGARESYELPWPVCETVPLSAKEFDRVDDLTERPPQPTEALVSAFVRNNPAPLPHTCPVCDTIVALSDKEFEDHVRDKHPQAAWIMERSVP